ncbi:MAG: thioredoxin family protein [Gemmataceae bacterium]|nr:thioredoxin family protein [Gemmataceae bacterium]
MSPVIDSLAGQFAGRVKVGKVNIHENFELADEYDITGIPHLMLFHGGRKPLRQVKGLVPEAELVRILNDVLKH